jgi:hypothetical protein
MSERRRELIETAEFSAQFDAIVKRHSANVIVPVLTGLLDGIAKNPQVFGKTSWNTSLARSDSLGLTIPTFRIVFQIQDEGKDTECVLLLWIQEDSAFEEITGLLT